MEKIFATLVFYRHNIHMLHWKAVGNKFDITHKVCDEYVDKFNTMIDEVAEMMISLGKNPLTLNGCIDELQRSDENFNIIDSTKDYYSGDVFDMLDTMLGTIMQVYTNTIAKHSISIPSDCISKLDEHRYWIRIEKNYKLARRIK